MKLISTLFLTILTLGWVAAQDRPSGRFVNHTEFGGLFGRVKFDENGQSRVDSKSSLTIQTFNGMQVLPGLAAGVTVGVDWYNAALIMPVAAGVRYDLSKGKKAGFFLLADGGYGFTWLHQDTDGYDTKGGWMVNPGVGIRLGKIDNSSFTLSLTYKRQEASASKPLLYNQLTRDEDRVYNRLAVRVGIIF